MDIVAVKKRVREPEQTQKRLPVYESLRGLWREHSDSAELATLADQRYPGSMMFRVISYLRDWPVPPWQDACSEAELATLTAEMRAWRLQDNLADREVKWWFRSDR